MKKNSPWKMVGILAVVAALIGALVAMNRLNDSATGGATPAVAHDHDGDGKSDHAEH